LKEIKVNKSPGHDGITPKLLKVSAEIIAAPLSIIFNNVIYQRKYPSEWKKGQITPLRQSSNGDMEKTLFRPVTTLPALNNVFEKILASQLTHVQYSRPDSSGQNLESDGVQSKKETGSTVEST